MEKRKAYIITALIILLLLTGLAFWYLYTAKQDLKIGQVTELDLYGAGESVGRPIANSDGTGSTTTNPFGTPTINTGNTTGQAGLNEIITPEETAVEEPESWRLVQISKGPAVGASIIDSKIQYTDQKTGHIYISNKGGDKEKISGITLQGVYASYTMPDSATLLLKKNAYPTQVTLNDDGPIAVETEFFDTMLNVAYSGSYLYYTSTNEGGGVDVKSTKDTSKTLWSSYLSGWGLQVVSDHIVVTQYASHNIPGYAYILPKQGIATNTQPVPIAQDLPGLITNLSLDASQLLYSTSGKKGTTLYLKEVANTDIIPLSIKTLASKCTWGGDNTTFYCAVPSSIPSNLPDSWHKGQVHFTDSLWRINALTGDAFELAHATDLDIIEIVEDDGNGLIVFKNKTDQSLWAVVRQ